MMLECVDSAWRKEFCLGMKDTAPLMLGVFPFGLTFGMLALGAGLTAGRNHGHVVVGFCWSGAILCYFAAGPGRSVLERTRINHTPCQFASFVNGRIHCTLRLKASFLAAGAAGVWHGR